MTFYKLFLIYTLIFGFILTICSFLLTPKVKDTTNRAENSANGVQVLGVSLFCISATILFCGGSDEVSPRKKMLLIAFILVFSIIIITLVSIVHTDCEDARKITPVLLGFGVFSLVLSLVLFGRTIYQKRKGSIPSDGIELEHAKGGAPVAVGGDMSSAPAGGVNGGTAAVGAHAGGVKDGTAAVGAKGGVAVAGEPAVGAKGGVAVAGTPTEGAKSGTSAVDTERLKRGVAAPVGVTPAGGADAGVKRDVVGDATPAGMQEKISIDLLNLSKEQTERCKELLDAYTTTCLKQNTGTRVASASATHSTRLRGG